MNVAMILSAGLGTRLRPLTDELPKPLVPVGDRAAILHVQETLANAGIGRFVVNAHHRAEAFAGVPFFGETTLVHEPDLLGTAGGLANARAFLGDGPVVVWNGDILATLDVSRLHRAFVADPDLDAVWFIAPRARGEGSVGIGAGGEIVRVRDFRGGEEIRGGDFIGISLLAPSIVASLPSAGCLVGDVLGPRLVQGGRAQTIDHEGPWDDLGSPLAYLRANERWLRERGQTLHLGAGAQAPEGTTGIVGSGAVLTGAAPANAILWSNARAHNPPPNTIVTTAGLHLTVR